ncbi:MFS transporter [Arenivirga flava]|uniref:MFS transporter n=1 Tax=Arenivirga flava TaxID=1930060 RepID=A0AA37XBP5_9MICO|nr:MFS transporter [Arenivirga flava]GMA28575.1 MFS transporter [Arenivirga flava]
MNDAADARSRLTRRPGPGAIIAALGLAGLSASFMQTLVVPIQSRLPELLGEPAENTAWVVTVSLLAGAISTPIAGRIGDLYGKKSVLLALLGLLVIGSLVCALAGSLTMLLVGRALQGLSQGVVALGIAIMRDVLPPKRMPGGIAFMSATLGVGAALGLPISALVSEAFDWHALFVLAGALGVLNIVLSLIVVPPSTLRSEGRVDVPGSLLMAAGLGGVLLAATQGPVWGWTAPGTLGLGVGGLAVLVFWGWFQLRIDSPIVDLRVAARPAVLLTNLASVGMGFALFSSNISLPQLLELPAETGVGLGQSMLVASLVLMPSGLVMMAISPLSATLLRVIGGRIMLVTGSLIMAVTYLLATLISGDVWAVVLLSVLIGIGIGLGYAAMPTLIMSAVPPTETAAANGLNALMRALGTTAASASVGAMLAALSQPFGDGRVPTEEGFQLSFVAGAIASIASAVLALCIPRRRTAHGDRTALPETDGPRD